MNYKLYNCIYYKLNTKKILILQDEHVKKSDLFTAAKHLAESEVELIKIIENSSKCQRTTGNMPANVKKIKKSEKSGNVIIFDNFYNIQYFC